MTIVKFTPDGIQRSNVVKSEFFNESRETLLKAGFEPTVWVDYVIGRKAERNFFVTIRKNNIHVADQNGFVFTTKKVQRVVDLLSI